MSNKLPQCLEDVVTEKELEGLLQKLNIKYVKPALKLPVVVFPYGGELYVYDNTTKLAKHWIYDIDVREYIDQDYNKNFWRSILLETVVYHGTTEENLVKIWKKGKLEKKSKTRGISNRYLGPCIFCSCEKDSTGWYEAVIEILVGKMKFDGWMPEISLEPDVERYEAMEYIAHIIEMDDFSPDFEHGICPDTIIFYEDIPVKYLRICS